MSAAPQLNPQQFHAEPQRPLLQLHQPVESLARTSDDVHLAVMFLSCGAFTVAFAGFAVLPYLGQWLGL